MTAPPPYGTSSSSGIAISVIIPAWNEGEAIRATLEAVLAQEPAPEVLVVDAASADETTAIAERMSVPVLHSTVRQRAAQMNLGATHTRGDTLLFLHADTLLPVGALQSMARALQYPRVVGGAFRRQFHPPNPLLRAIALLTRFRNRTVGWHLGDQAIFCRRTVFEALGGFIDFDRFEDLDFSRRLGRLGRLVTLHPPVTTSARRFARLGAAHQTARDFLLTLRYLSGNRAVCHREQITPMPAQTHAPQKPS